MARHHPARSPVTCQLNERRHFAGFCRRDAFAPLCRRKIVFASCVFASSRRREDNRHEDALACAPLFAEEAIVKVDRAPQSERGKELHFPGFYGIGGEAGTRVKSFESQTGQGIKNFPCKGPFCCFCTFSNFFQTVKSRPTFSNFLYKRRAVDMLVLD